MKYMCVCLGVCLNNGKLDVSIRKDIILMRVYGVVVSRSLCMRKASGSIPDISNFLCEIFIS